MPVGESPQNLCSIGIDIEIPTSEDLADMGRVLPDFDIESYLNGMGDEK